ncbi:LiaI-LiaF-like domain-containing protein [Anaerosporobacter sp.]
MEQMEEVREVRKHRIGSYTFGLTLIVYGVLFLVHIFAPAISYDFIFRLWPLTFISLGIEVLLGSRREDTRFVYDKVAIILLILLTIFAVFMAGVDCLMRDYEYWRDGMLNIR